MRNLKKISYELLNQIIIMSLFSLNGVICLVLVYVITVKRTESREIVRRTSCSDKLELCLFLSNACTSNPAWAKKYCPYSCELCDKCVSSENNIYNKGDKWCHGNEICTCIDGSLSNGSYTCQFKGCPIYKGVPFECPLIWNPNTCCPMPNPNHKNCSEAEIVGTQMIG